MSRAITCRDAVIAASFALFALAFQLQRWGGYDPVIFMGSDAANLTAFAAARANPHLFIGDMLLGNINNYKFYWTIHLFAMQALGSLTADYGKGLVFLLGPLVLLHMLGYYILGRVLYHSRLWALIFSLTTSVYIETPVEDVVGLMPDPLPRFAFGALLPYLLSVIVRFQDDTTKWKLIMACCAGLTYVHPVSGPAWVFGLWLLYTLSNPGGLVARQRVRRAFALGVVASLVVLPFAMLYVGSHDTAPSDPAKAAAIMDAVKARINPVHLNPIRTLGVFSKWLLTDFHFTYLALLSLYFVFRSETSRREARTLFTLVCGVLVFSVLIPSVEYYRRTVSSGIPFQIDLMRPLKFVVLAIFLFSIWGLKEATSQSIKSKSILSLVSVLIGSVFVFYVHSKFVGDALAIYGQPSIVHFVYPTIRAWRHGELGPTPEHLTDVEAIRAVRHLTPERSKIFVTSDRIALQVRFAALRPVVYAYKDGGAFTYSNYNALLKWHEVYTKLGGRFKQEGYSPAELEQTIVPVARDLDADYLLASFAPRGRQNPHDVDLGRLRHVWSNWYWGLYKLAK